MPQVAGDAARLVDPCSISHIADALRIVMSDTSIQAQMSAAGLARARDLRWSDFAQANVAIYRALLEDS